MVSHSISHGLTSVTRWIFSSIKSQQALYQRKALLLDQVNCSIVLLDGGIKHCSKQCSPDKSFFFPYGRSDIAWWNITSILRNCESLSETHSILSFPATIQPLLPIEHNGPGLEYKVSYRRQDVEEDWKENTVKRHSFVVKNTPTFVPYEIKIQAKNRQGFGPEPKLVTGYSGEDCEYKLIFFQYSQ